jgi:hypothetical protein
LGHIGKFKGQPPIMRLVTPNDNETYGELGELLFINAYFDTLIIVYNKYFWYNIIINVKVEEN